MTITVVIENTTFEIDCDKGAQDIAWISLCDVNFIKKELDFKKQIRLKLILEI